MKTVFSLYTPFQIEELRNSTTEVTEVIIGFEGISRFWNWTAEECLRVAEELKGLGLKVFLQWDILMTESVFQGTLTRLKDLNFLKENSPFDGIRVQDSGALNTLIEMDYSKEIHFLAEQGNHNLIGLKSWLKLSPGKIKRIVLSPELPHKTLLEYQREMNCELEYLGFGPLLLFYTPRHLVSPLYFDQDKSQGKDQSWQEIRVMGTSEESPHKGFPIRDNLHGTFMFNTKDQFILREEAIAELSEMIFRIDLSEGPGELSLCDIFKLDEVSLKKAYSRPLTKGFFRVNKTDVLFKKLKNSRLQGRDESLLGEVVDVKKGKHIGVLITHPSAVLNCNEEVQLLSPEGREKTLLVKSLKDASGEIQESAHFGQIVFLPHLGGISIKTLVFRSLE